MKKHTYISLFSSAGVGCYGFKQEKFDCIATNELLEKRLNIQKCNRKCKYNSGYILGDITLQENHDKIFSEIAYWKKKEKIKDVDVLVATPPCQGMSVANHKKNNEQKRNSLIIESIKLVSEISPRYFVFENVRAFLNTICTNVDGKDMPIGDAIDINLGGDYNILKEVVNFKEYGANSSRTRTLVIGVRKDIKDITPYDIFPNKEKEKTLKKVIGHYPNLLNMGEVDSDDIYHHFRTYDVRMIDWIKDVPEGKSAFDNLNPIKRPHRVVNGKIVYNKNSNGDKYTRCEWNKVAPCIHTRNDIMASQSTLHPCDNRVFSIRELMNLMNIPDSFKWVEEKLDVLNNMSYDNKISFLKREAINIRQSIGEAVPTVIFKKIANNIKDIEKKTLTTKEINNLIISENISNSKKLIEYIDNNKNKLSYNTISRIVEFSNLNRDKHSAFYTPQSICFNLVKNLPDFKNKEIKVLEPSVGIGNFIPLLAKRYGNHKLIIDVVDIDDNILKALKILNFEKIYKNVKINYMNKDFLLFSNDKKYDLVIGNPPFGKVKNKSNLLEYRKCSYNKKTSNLFAFFLEKSSISADYTALITPKSILSSPEFNLTREFLEKNSTLMNIIDFGEKGFDGVKIETVSMILNNRKVNRNYNVKIESYITQKVVCIKSSDLFDKEFNMWLIYKNDFFKKIKKKMFFSIFNFYRDRLISKKHTKSCGEIRVLKSRNLKNNAIVDVENYDCFIDDISPFAVKKYLNSKSILIPNLSYYPRACFLPENSIADGSLAILQPKNGYLITKDDLEYYSSDEFKEFYMIGRNLGTRSLNIDSNSINLWGIRKEEHKDEHK